ncbi:MAG: MBL fold metallo-hydrolase [Clostridia bacterium]|nr:MBL fold metallo-hydrolase [Clostridia bacterium]
MFVKPNIYKVDCTGAVGDSYGSYVYAIKNEHGVTLIDTYFPGKVEEIVAELKAAGMEPVDRILFTHADLDHTGNSAWLQKHYNNCPVYLSARELEAVREPAKSKSGKGGVFDGVEEPVMTVLEGEEIAGIRIIPAYGHTYGHTCFLYDKTLFAGDLICTEQDEIWEMELKFIRDREQSWKAVEDVDQACDFDLLCPSHGEPLACTTLLPFTKREG